MYGFTNPQAPAETLPARRSYLVAAVALAALATATAALAHSKPRVLSPASKHLGRTYAQWSAKDWQWELEQPNVSSSPVVDPNPGTKSNPQRVNCRLGQSGKVWFLSGIFSLTQNNYTVAYRKCSIPAGKYLYFPVVDAWQDDLNCPGQPSFTQTGAQLQQIVAAEMDDVTSMRVVIDHHRVSGLSSTHSRYRVAANGFSYTLPANNALSQACPGDPFPAGTMPPDPPGAYADGYYIMLAPLSRGVHHLMFAATASGPYLTGSANVHYILHVR
jgi:opacity protein-like surface antigen